MRFASLSSQSSANNWQKARLKGRRASPECCVNTQGEQYIIWKGFHRCLHYGHFLKSASMNLLRGVKLLQFNALVCAFSQGCSLCPVPKLIAPLPFISFLPQIL